MTGTGAVPLKSYETHLADLRTLLAPRATRTVEVADAVDLELAADVVSPADLPAFATSAMDGYAVRVADVPGRLRVAGEVAAGQLPAVAVGPGTAVRVMTGSPLPAGTEAVVPVEDTAPDGDGVRITAGTEPARHLRPAGGDLRTGEVVLPAGTRIGPAQLAALLYAGISRVEIQAAVRVAVLSTGDELVPAGTTPGPAQLVDSNGPGLALAAAASGAHVLHVGHAPDRPGEFLAALDALPEVDLVLTSGGVSMGEYDVVKAALAPLGVHFEKIAIQPGRPQGWGRYRGGPAFLGLPGNPVSALLTFELFGRAVLGRERPVLRATLTDPIASSPAGIRQFRRGRLERGRAEVLAGAASHLLSGLARADCLVVVPESATSVAAGDDVEVISLSP